MKDKSSPKTQNYCFFHKKGFLLASSSVLIPIQSDIQTRKGAWTASIQNYWVCGWGEVEIVKIGVVKRAVSALLISWISHALQGLHVKTEDGADQHPYSE